MNEVLRQLQARKSVRVYEDRPVEAEVKRAVLEAAIQAPSAGNMALFTILDITDPDIKAKLAVSCDDQPFIATAPLVLIFCADYRRWYDVFRSHVEEVRKPDMGDLFLAEADALIAAGKVQEADFPLLIHVDELINQGKKVNVPWKKFETEFVV